MVSRLQILLAFPLAIWLGATGLVPSSYADGGPRLRPVAEISATDVRLGDLFEGAGALSDRVVMAAPAPGETYHLTLGQIFEMANSHGLAWRPVAPFEMVVVRRAWRHLDNAEIYDALLDALYAVGAPRPLSIEVPNTALDIKVGRGMLVELSFEDTNYTLSKDRFQTTLVVSLADGQRRRYTLAGAAFAEVDVPVLNNRLRTDQVIGQRDIRWQRMRRSRLPNDAITDAQDLIGKSPTRMIPPGRVLTVGNVGAPILVTRGALVSMHLVAQNMHLVATGRALEAGSMGDLIQIQNASSRIAVDAVVTGSNRVEVYSSSQLAAHDIGRGDQLQ